MTYPTIATMVKPQKMEIDQNVNTFPQVNQKPVSNTLLTSSSLDAVMDMKPMGSIESDGLLTYPLYIVGGGVTVTDDVSFGSPAIGYTNQFILGNAVYPPLYMNQYIIKKGGVYDTTVSLILTDIINIQKIVCEVCLYNTGVVVAVLDRFIIEGKVPSFSTTSISSCGIDGPCIAGGVSTSLSQVFSELPYTTYNIRMSKKVYIRRNPIGRDETVGVRLSLTSGVGGDGSVSVGELSASGVGSHFQLERLKKQR